MEAEANNQKPGKQQVVVNLEVERDETGSVGVQLRGDLTARTNSGSVAGSAKSGNAATVVATKKPAGGDDIGVCIFGCFCIYVCM